MLFLFCQCQLRHINHAYINISTYVLGGRRWHGIWRIRSIPARYWRNLQLWSCVLWRSWLLLTYQGKLRWINDLIIQCRRHSYHRRWQLIALLVTVFAMKAPVITRSILWRSGWLLTNLGQLMCIDYLIIKCMRHMYHWWWQIISLWVTVISIKAPVITRSHLLPTLVVPCSTFVATYNTLLTWNDECIMSLWCCCVPVIFFVDVQQKVRHNFLARHLKSCLSFSTRNKIDYELFVSI